MGGKSVASKLERLSHEPWTGWSRARQAKAGGGIRQRGISDAGRLNSGFESLQVKQDLNGCRRQVRMARDMRDKQCAGVETVYIKQS